MTLPDAAPLSRRDWAIIVAITAAGCALRIAMAQGALWLDEAWSAMHAHEVATPLGIFLGINHDNNHHLNSLWMQAVGIDAPPLLQRALAIATGTASIVVAARLMARSGNVAAIVAAALFAFSPFFANYGSEARGYAPMILALLMVMLHVDRWLAGAPRPTTSLILWAMIGMLSQLMMAIGLVAVAGWAFVTLRQRDGWRSAVRETLRSFAPAAVAAAAVLGGILLAARINSGGMRFGNLEPFTYFHQLKALFSVVGYTIGVPEIELWPGLALLVALGVAIRIRIDRLPLYWLALIGFPIVVAIVHPANPGHARYYTLIAVAMLLMIADIAARGWSARGWLRAAAATGIAAILVASVVEDIRLIANQRGDPGRAITAMAALTPDGATAFVERDSAVPVLATAARTGQYPLAIRRSPCPAPDYLFIDRYNGESLPGPQRRCGRDYVPIATMRARGMTNFHWRLYRRR
ncbi:hypothetical protein GCM10009106_09500 [Sphingomonas japonica]